MELLLRIDEKLVFLLCILDRQKKFLEFVSSSYGIGKGELFLESKNVRISSQ